MFITQRHQILIPQLLISLHELSIFLSSSGGGGSSQLYLPWGAAYPDRLYAVEYRILLALFGDDSSANVHSRQLFSDTTIPGQQQLCTVLLHAMLLFIYTNLRETPVGGVLRARLIQRLQNALIMTGMVDDLASRFPEEMLWVSVLGTAATAAVGSNDMVEYELSVMSAILSRLRHEYDLRRWADVRVFLARMPAFMGPFATRCMELLQGPL